MAEKCACIVASTGLKCTFDANKTALRPQYCNRHQTCKQDAVATTPTATLCKGQSKNADGSYRDCSKIPKKGCEYCSTHDPVKDQKAQCNYIVRTKTETRQCGNPQKEGNNFCSLHLKLIAEKERTNASTSTSISSVSSVSSISSKPSKPSKSSVDHEDDDEDDEEESVLKKKLEQIKLKKQLEKIKKELEEKQESERKQKELEEKQESDRKQKELKAKQESERKQKELEAKQMELKEKQESKKPLNEDVKDDLYNLYLNISVNLEQDLLDSTITNEIIDEVIFIFVKSSVNELILKQIEDKYPKILSNMRIESVDDVRKGILSSSKHIQVYFYNNDESAERFVNY